MWFFSTCVIRTQVFLKGQHCGKLSTMMVFSISNTCWAVTPLTMFFGYSKAWLSLETCFPVRSASCVYKRNCWCQRTHAHFRSLPCTFVHFPLTPTIGSLLQKEPQGSYSLTTEATAAKITVNILLLLKWLWKMFLRVESVWIFPHSHFPLCWNPNMNPGWPSRVQ